MIMSLLETIRKETHSNTKLLESSNRENKQLFANLKQQLSALSEQTEQLASKVDAINTYEVSEFIKHPENIDSSFTVLAEGNKIASNVTIENESFTIDQVIDGREMSFSQEELKINEDSSVNSAAPSLNNYNDNCAPKGHSNPTVNDMMNYKKDDMGTVEIGPNKSAVKKLILLNINWNSHQHATRMLTSTLFSREELLKQTVSGRGRMGDQLNPSIVADIVDMITTTCKVKGGVVTNTIGTICWRRAQVEKKKCDIQAKQMPAIVPPTPAAIQEILSSNNNRDDEELFIIGNNGTSVENRVIRSINWKDLKDATKTLLIALFTRKELGTHSVSALRCKQMLNREIIEDIEQLVSTTFNVTAKEVSTEVIRICRNERKTYDRSLKVLQQQLSITATPADLRKKMDGN